MVGKCHICKGIAEIEWCRVCGHWFCSPCRRMWFSRGVEAIKEILTGATPGCCGPVPEETP